jgi:transcriptional regulator with XRE-family HTH domain
MNYSAEMKTIDTLAERLAWARKRLELSQQQLATMCGMAQSTIGSLEAGTRFSARKISVIAEVLGVDTLWLAEGKGAPPDEGAPLARKPSMVSQRPAQMQWVSDEEAQLLSLYRSAADDRGRELIRLTADSVPKALFTGLTGHES